MDENDPDVDEHDGDRPDTDQPTASALVILRAPTAPGTDPRVDVVDRPDPERIRHVQDHLRSLGFDVGALIGTSFSISAPAGLFRRSFGQGPPSGPDRLGSERAHDDAGTGADRGPQELPIDRLPGDAAEAIEAIVFAPPPDFGPGAP